MNKMVSVQNGAVLATEAGYELIAKAREIHELQKNLKLQEDQFKKELMEAMEKNSIKRFENDLVTITYTGPSKRATVDTAKLKEQGLYEAFKKESDVKASVKVIYKD